MRLAFEKGFQSQKRTPLTLDNCVGETLVVTTCHLSEGTDALHSNPSWRRRSWWSYPAEEEARDYCLHCGCLSTTKQGLLWHSATGQSKGRKTPGSFVGPLSDLTVSDESEVEITNWLFSKTLPGPVNLLGFAMWYIEKRADGDNSLEFCWPFLLGVISSCTLSLFENQERLSLVLESVMNDFLRFIVKSRDWRRVITSWVFFIASSTVAAKRRKSSRYVRTQMAFLLRDAATGFKTFVKILGAEQRPNGRALNW